MKITIELFDNGYFEYREDDGITFGSSGRARLIADKDSVARLVLPLRRGAINFGKVSVFEEPAPIDATEALARAAHELADAAIALKGGG